MFKSHPGHNKINEVFLLCLERKQLLASVWCLKDFSIVSDQFFLVVLHFRKMEVPVALRNRKVPAEVSQAQRYQNNTEHQAGFFVAVSSADDSTTRLLRKACEGDRE